MTVCHEVKLLVVGMTVVTTIVCNCLSFSRQDSIDFCGKWGLTSDYSPEVGPSHWSVSLQRDAIYPRTHCFGSCCDPTRQPIMCRYFIYVLYLINHRKKAEICYHIFSVFDTIRALFWKIVPDRNSLYCMYIYIYIYIYNVCEYCVHSTKALDTIIDHW